MSNVNRLTVYPDTSHGDGSYSYATLDGGKKILDKIVEDAETAGLTGVFKVLAEKTDDEITDYVLIYADDEETIEINKTNGTLVNCCGFRVRAGYLEIFDNYSASLNTYKSNYGGYQYATSSSTVASGIYIYYTFSNSGVFISMKGVADAATTDYHCFYCKSIDLQTNTTFNTIICDSLTSTAATSTSVSFVTNNLIMLNETITNNYIPLPLVFTGKDSTNKSSQKPISLQQITYDTIGEHTYNTIDENLLWTNSFPSSVRSLYEIKASDNNTYLSCGGYSSFFLKEKTT